MAQPQDWHYISPVARQLGFTTEADLRKHAAFRAAEQSVPRGVRRSSHGRFLISDEFARAVKLHWKELGHRIPGDKRPADEHGQSGNQQPANIPLEQYVLARDVSETLQLSVSHLGDAPFYRRAEAELLAKGHTHYQLVASFATEHGQPNLKGYTHNGRGHRRCLHPAFAEAILRRAVEGKRAWRDTRASGRDTADTRTQTRHSRGKGHTGTRGQQRRGREREVEEEGGGAVVYVHIGTEL